MTTRLSKFAVVLTIGILLPSIGCKESTFKLKREKGGKNTSIGSAAEKILEESLHDLDAIIRVQAIEAVANSSQKQFLPTVAEMITDDYVPVRFGAAITLGDMKYSPARKNFEKLTRAPDENTRIAACYAMYKMGSKQYLSPLSQAAKSTDQSVRANAVMLLGKTGNKTVLDVLYTAKNSDISEPFVRYQAAEAIARLGDKKIIDKLWTMLISKFVENKIIGIKALGALGTAQAKEILLTKLDDDILEVRLVTAEQLGMLGDNSGIPVVQSVFDQKLTNGLDREGYERIMVFTAFAIGRIGTEDVTRYLPKLIEDESKVVRLAAAQAVLQTTKR